MTSRVYQKSRKVRRFLAGSSPSEDPVFPRINIAYERARWIVQFYYLASAYVAYEICPEIFALREQSEAWELLWPVRWIGWLGTGLWPDVVPVACVVASLVAFQFPTKVLPRCLVAVLSILVVALTNSQGAMGHAYYYWAWIGVCFAFLPTTPAVATREFRMTYLSVIVATQMLILFFYSLAGLWKTRHGLVVLLNGGEGNFSPRGLALQLADRMLATGTKPLLADLAITYYWISGPAFLGIIYFQFTAVLAALRPRLHLLWAYVLISFHLGTWLLMNIYFPHHILFVGLLFGMSPFLPMKWSFKAVVADMPGMGIVRFVAQLTRGQPVQQPA